MEYLFSYGTLRNEEIQLAIFGRVVSTTLDALPDYVLRTVSLTNWKAAGISGGEMQKTVEPCPGGLIVGMVLEVSEEELRLCDDYEPVDYERIKVPLRSGKNAWLYFRI